MSELQSLGIALAIVTPIAGLLFFVGSDTFQDLIDLREKRKRVKAKEFLGVQNDRRILTDKDMYYIDDVFTRIQHHDIQYLNEIFSKLEQRLQSLEEAKKTKEKKCKQK